MAYKMPVFVYVMARMPVLEHGFKCVRDWYLMLAPVIMLIIITMHIIITIITHCATAVVSQRRSAAVN